DPAVTAPRPDGRVRRVRARPFAVPALRPPALPCCGCRSPARRPPLPALRLPGLRFQTGARLRAVRAHLAAEAAGPLVGAQGVLDAAVELAVDLVVVQEQL